MNSSSKGFSPSLSPSFLPSLPLTIHPFLRKELSSWMRRHFFPCAFLQDSLGCGLSPCNLQVLSCSRSPWVQGLQPLRRLVLQIWASFVCQSSCLSELVNSTLISVISSTEICTRPYTSLRRSNLCFPVAAHKAGTEWHPSEWKASKYYVPQAILEPCLVLQPVHWLPGAS